MKTLLLATSLSLCIAYAWSQPHGNRGLYFNGTGAYVEVQQAPALPFTGASDFTVSLWVKPDKLGNMSLFDNVPDNTGENRGMLNLWVVLEENGQVTFGLGGQTLAWDFLKSVNRYEPNKWMHLALVKKQGNSLLYINGVLDASMPLAATTLNATQNNAPINFGRLRLESAKFLAGQLDEIKVFSSARTPAEIMSNMKSSSVNDAALLAYWNFEDNADVNSQVVVRDVKSGLNGNAIDQPLWTLRITSAMDDSSVGTLHWAVSEANKDTDADYIDLGDSYSLPSLMPSSPLHITQPVFLGGHHLK
jgi:Concanavalin A-like lectin/glucanases superfamily